MHLQIRHNLITEFIITGRIEGVNTKYDEKCQMFKIL